ncbi:hypothetical protein [Saccharopolyspora gregorii]|uniref:DUF222 domain-containing protein n=1 Tax=Saccharopolyspora gregorii TaxID=33914 RepID=A0ABP6RWW5_9PSEU
MGIKRGRSHLCGSARTLSGRPCRNKVRSSYPSRYCKEHRFCGRRGAFRVHADDVRDRRRREREAVAVLVADPWPRTVQQRCLAVVDGATWEEFLAQRANRACRVLADVAARVERADRLSAARLHDLVLGGAERDDAVRRVAAAVAVAVSRRVGDPAEVAFAVRVLGVFCCASAAEVERCPCRRAVVERFGPRVAADKLARGLPERLAA